MEVVMQSVNFKADSKLTEFIEKKVSKLEKFYGKIVDVEVFLRVEKIAEKTNKIAEIKIHVPGNEFVVKKEARSFEKGISMVVDVLKRKLRKVKEKSKQ